MSVSALRLPGPARRRLALGAGAKAIELAAQAAMLLLLPAVLGLADFGRLALALTLVALGGTAASVGGPALTARLVAGVAPERRARAVAALGRRMAALRGALVLVAGLVALILALALPDRIDPVLAALIVLALGLDVAATLAAQLALAAGRTGPWSLRYATQNVLVVALVPVGYALAGLPGAVAALAVAALGPLGLGLAVLARAAPRGGWRGELLPAEVAAPRLAAQAGLSGLLAQVTFRGGVVLVAVLHGPVATARDAVAIGIALAGVYAVGALFAAMLPAQARAAAEDPTRAEADCGRLAEALLPLAVAAALGGAAAAGLLDAWGAGAAVGTALGLVALAPLLSGGAQASMLTLRADLRLRATATGALAYAISAPALVVGLDALGAALALTLACLATIGSYRRALPRALAGRSVAPAIGGVLGAAGLAHL